jgi:hypothetical protein
MDQCSAISERIFRVGVDDDGVVAEVRTRSDPQWSQRFQELDVVDQDHALVAASLTAARSSVVRLSAPHA